MKKLVHLMQLLIKTSMMFLVVYKKNTLISSFLFIFLFHGNADITAQIEFDTSRTRVGKFNDSIDYAIIEYQIYEWDSISVFLLPELDSLIKSSEVVPTNVRENFHRYVRRQYIPFYKDKKGSLAIKICLYICLINTSDLMYPQYLSWSDSSTFIPAIEVIYEVKSKTLSDFSHYKGFLSKKQEERIRAGKVGVKH